MRLSLDINGRTRVVAAVNGPGYLSAHINLSERPKDDDSAKTVRVRGTQTLETETVSIDWPSFQLQIGDKLEFQLLPDGDGDAPSAVSRSSESPSNLFSNIDLAKELLQLVADFETRLMKLVDKSKEIETSEEHKRFTNAVGGVLYENGRRLLYPVYRRHEELIPDDLKGELL